MRIVTICAWKQLPESQIGLMAAATRTDKGDYLNKIGLTLATLRCGQKGIIQSIDTSDPVVQRLMILGLVEGAELEHASSAIGGDPMEFRLFGNAISLRKEHARQFSVSTDPEGG